MFAMNHVPRDVSQELSKHNDVVPCYSMIIKVVSGLGLQKQILQLHLKQKSQAARKEDGYVSTEQGHVIATAHDYACAWATVQ